MKKINILFVLLFLAFLSCSDENETTPEEVLQPVTSKNKIMPLGASRVAGARPNYESFRYELWKLLVDNEIDFDYIGTQNDGASYPTFQNQSFDTDHEGRGGWTSGQISNEIDSWLAETGAPDIVLFSSPGGNDALQGLSYDAAITNINTIIDAIQASNANVIIVIEQLAPARSDIMTQELTGYFNQITQDLVTIANEQTTATSQVLLVDMATGFNDSFLADPVHYNEAGAQFIAERYYDLLKDILE